MKNIVSFFPKEELKEATDLFGRAKNISYSGSGNGSSKAMLISDIFRSNKGVGRTLWVVSDINEQPIVRKAMDMWSDRNIYTFKSKSDNERLSYPSFSEFERAKRVDLVEFVSNIYSDESGVFVLDFESLMEDFPNAKNLFDNKFSVSKGDSFDVVNFIERLVGMGYEVTDFEKVNKGEYFRVGDSLIVYPINNERVVRIEIKFDEIEGVFEVDDDDYSKQVKKLNSVDIISVDYENELDDIIDLFNEKDLIIDDEVDVVDEYYEGWNKFMEKGSNLCHTISFTTFNDDVSHHNHLHFLSILKYRNSYDLANDLRDKISAGWNVLFFTKHINETRGLLTDQAIPFMIGLDDDKFSKTSIFLIEVDKDSSFPVSFQAPKQKVLLISDVDVAQVRDEKKRVTQRNVFDDFLTSLKNGDYVVHADHGIAKFFGLDQKTVDGITKEYLKLVYAENDKLFVPIDQADKVNKYIGSEELMPKLTRLGSAEWNTLTSRVKKETQKIAKELLKLYAERSTAKGHAFMGDEAEQKKFDETFPYDETPGQIKAIEDVKSDMENPSPMDRLICGDVGFGKTEVAMRATFKAVKSGWQVAVISPITILADQHYKSFKKRMEGFGIRVEMMSRFRTQKQQKEILVKLKKGEIDVVIGTHRLLQTDVDFKNLGLVVIDEEQRFGVKQKEKLKEIRKEVDILTLTATPIPRTLNICLNKLRDITTITTPPFGRLPIITEVRKFSPSLMREVLLKEIERGGQAYVLHNRVQTIDSFADKIRELVPEAKVGVAHGKLGSGDLEDRIMAFTEGRYNVLVSSTIIENGIDLANANTLIVNNAERFGLSQLYQLRGRVGRGKAQAYAYFLYHGQRLKLDAKKRLRAIVEASELGSGFQIAMKDLEIRGAGDILGANQHGVINVVGVSHFMRMLNRAVEDLKTGRIMDGDEEIGDVSVELPVPAYIPESYVADSRKKIGAYQKLSSASDLDYLAEVREEMVEDYGKMPIQVHNLFKIIEMKMAAKTAGLVNVKAETVPMSKDKEIVLYMSKKVKPANIISLLEGRADWQITGSRLRISITKLGADWFKGLQDDIAALAKEVKHGKR